MTFKWITPDQSFLLIPFFPQCPLNDFMQGCDVFQHNWKVYHHVTPHHHLNIILFQNFDEHMVNNHFHDLTDMTYHPSTTYVTPHVTSKWRFTYQIAWQGQKVPENMELSPFLWTSCFSSLLGGLGCAILHISSMFVPLAQLDAWRTLFKLSDMHQTVIGNELQGNIIQPSAFFRHCHCSTEEYFSVILERNWRTNNLSSFVIPLWKGQSVEEHFKRF